MLFCRMDISDAPPPNIPYRGYTLQILFKTPQYQVVIAPLLGQMPELAVEKRIVRGWNQDEVVKRAKLRVDDMVDS
jgi:hypothetical protein